MGQTGARWGPTEIAPTFLGIKRALQAQTMSIPLTTGANRNATVLHWDSTVLTPGQTRGGGGSSTHSVYHGGDKDVAGVIPAYHGI